MHNVPTEVLLLVLNYLDLTDLSRTSRCCKRLHQLANGKLYETLRLQIKMHGPDDQTAKVLGTLLQNPRLREPLRHIDVQFDEDSLWTQSHSRLLAVSLMQILKPDRGVHEGRKESRIAPGIRSYRWTTGYSFTGLVFPDLENIDCRSIGPHNLEWLRWHLTYCKRLVQVRLSFRRLTDLTPGAAGNLLNGTALHHLRHLSLSYINVAALQPSRISRLESLELYGCAGVEEFLDRLANEVPSSLRVVRITAHSKSGRFRAYTAWLRSAQNVENITLCIGGLARVIPLDDIGAHGSTLRTLILDARRNLWDPASVCAYSPDDLRRVVNMCCRLRTLGMPIDLRDYQRQRYTRSPQLKRIIPRCKLEVLHLRGHRNSAQRSQVDAKHLARRFLLTQRDMRVVVGHGKRLRGFRAADGKMTKAVAVSSVERFRLCAD